MHILLLNCSTGFGVLFVLFWWGGLLCFCCGGFCLFWVVLFLFCSGVVVGFIDSTSIPYLFFPLEIFQVCFLD